MALKSSYHHPIRHSVHHLLRFLSVLLLLHPRTTTVATIDEGFTMELIHRYSERSPYYNENLTESQIQNRIVEHSKSYGQWLESTHLDTNITTLRPPMFVHEYLYLVPLGIGTGVGHQFYYLQFDTGSSLTWIQCLPCDPCFHQRSPLFDPLKSPTYHPIKHDHPLCAPEYRTNPDERRNCWYEIDYDEGSSTRGILSQEAFTFHSNNQGHPEVLPNLAFGCSRSTNLARATGRDGASDGILGLGNMQVSILRQLFHHTHGRFSYCLVKRLNNIGAAGYLRFGGDFVMSRLIQTTPLNLEDGVSHYYVTLNGISFLDRRLHFPPGTFAHGHRSFFHTGSGVTHLIKPVYDQVRSELVRFFSTLPLTHISRRSGMRDLDLCYKIPSTRQDVLPHLTLHLEGADYHVGWEQLFMFDHSIGIFCWAMMSSNRFTFIGVHQQYNVRFSYDIGAKELSFAPENCAYDVHHQ